MGHVLSLLSLLAATLVFTSNESLHCGRVSVHLNLFLSFILSNICWLVWDNAVLPFSSLWTDNPLWCRLFNLVITYFTITTYFWMLCEGGYLQMVLLNTFESDKNRLRVLMILGWEVPALCVAPYGVYRAVSNHPDCWMDLGESVWFIGVPVLIIILLNVVIMVNVIITIRSKITQPPTVFGGRPTRLSRGYSKHLRAVCVLVPVLGIHFLLVPVRPEPKSPYEYSYDLLLTVSSSFQGWLVHVVQQKDLYSRFTFTDVSKKYLENDAVYSGFIGEIGKVSMNQKFIFLLITHRSLNVKAYS